MLSYARRKKIPDNQNDDVTYDYDEAIEEAIKLFGSDAVVRTNAYEVENILDHRNDTWRAGDLGDHAERVIVEEATKTHPRGEPKRTAWVWELRRVYDTSLIAWNEEPLATIYRHRDYGAFFGP